MTATSAIGALLLAVVQPVSGGTLNLLQWNPHWQCFAWNQDNCSAQAEAHAKEFLEEYDVDFANFVEFEPPGGYRPPAKWSMLPSSSACTKDQTAVLWNNDQWSKSTMPGSSRTGCLSTQNRPYIVQLFERNEGAAPRPGVPDKIVVVGAHFPHWGDDATLKSVLADVMSATGVKDVVLIADTNLFNSTSNREVGHMLGFPGSTLVSTTLEPTCCADSNFSPYMTFDRVIANFGSSMKTTVLLEVVPPWAEQNKNGRIGAFHKPILGSLSVPGTAAPEEGVVSMAGTTIVV